MKLGLVLHQFLPRHVTGTEQYARSVALGLRRRGHQVVLFAYEPLIQLAAPDRTWFERDEVVDGIPVHRVSVHPETRANHELGDYENPVPAQLLGRWLERERPDVVHVLHPRDVGTAAVTAPRALGIPVVVNLMDFWFLCPNFMLLRRSGELCQGPPDGGLGCIPCIDPALWQRVEAQGIAGELRAIGEGNAGVAGLRPTVAARAHALVARKPRLFEVLAQADAVVAPSRFLRAMFERAGFPPGRIVHVPYGVDPDRLASGRAAVLAARHAGGAGGGGGTGGAGGAGGAGDAGDAGGAGSAGGEVLAPRARVAADHLSIGYVGSITPHKGLHVLLDAVRLLRGEGWRLHVHGSTRTHPPYRRQVREVAARERRIRFHGPFEPAHLGAVLDTLDVIVVPSLWYENTPFSVLEALAVRLPVVASALGGIGEVVEQERNGLLFAPGDAAALAAALQRLVDEPDLLSRLQSGPPPRTLAQNLDDFERLYARVRGAAVQRR